MEKLIQVLMKFAKERFHGSITINFAHGVPKNLETKQYHKLEQT